MYHLVLNSRYEKDTSSADDLFNGLGWMYGFNR